MRSGKAEALDFQGVECDALELTATYWAGWTVVEQAKEAGAVTSYDSCQQLSDTAGDFMVPDATYMDCICRALFGDSTKPLCRQDHSVCVLGSPFPPAVMSDGSCTPTDSQVVAANVCQFDPYCCTTEWDSYCYLEMNQDYWLSATGYVAQAVNNPTNCPLPPGGISDPALYLQECPGGHETRETAGAYAVQDLQQQAATFRAGDASCLATPANIALSGIFSDGDYNRWTTDWDQGFSKGYCSAGFPQLGLSIDPNTGTPHRIMCEWVDANRFTGNLAAAVLNGEIDNRRAYRSVGGQSDWDVGFWKLECGNNEYVFATDQEFGTHKIHGIACGSSTGLSSNTCRTVPFNNGEDAGVGNWDPNFTTAECASNEYMAGLSLDMSSMPHQLLCCQR